MKRLFRIGSGLFFYSIIPILSWIVLGYVLGDNRISNVFSITYAMQFVYSIFRYFFGSGANIRKEKEQTPNAVWNGIFWGTIFSALIFAIPLIFVDNYIAFFGQDVEFYRIYVIYGIALLFLQTLFSFIIEKLYFEDNDKLANIHLFAFNLTNFAVLILSCLLIPNTLIALLLTLGVLLVYIICLYVKEFQKFKIDLGFFKNFRYESASIVSSIFMLLIYLFGFKNAFSAGEEYLFALNIISLCTDAQWDCLGAIDTIAKVDISKGRFEYKKELKNAHVFMGVVVASSIIMSVALSFVNKVSIPIALAYLAFQVADMLMTPYTTILSIFTQIEYSAKLNTIAKFTTKVIRTVLSVFILSPFCTEIGQVAESALLILALIVIRALKYKVVDGKLTIKNKERTE